MTEQHARAHALHAVQGADEAIFVLAPVLLLLSQDALICRGLSAQRRYFPPFCAASLFLAASAASGAFGRFSARSQRSPLVDGERVGPWYLLGSLLLTAATLPNHFYFLRVRPAFRPALAVPACVVCIMK